MSMQALQANFTFQGQKYKCSQKVGVINKQQVQKNQKTKRRKDWNKGTLSSTMNCQRQMGLGRLQ